MPYTDSDPSTEGLQLEGVWLHNPSNPTESLVQYRFGKANRGTSIETMPEKQVFAGREFPVFEYGEHTDITYTVKIDMPETSTTQDDLLTLIDFAELKQTLCLRDNRGRLAFGIIDGFSINDTDWGAEVGFNFLTNDYDEGEEAT